MVESASAGLSGAYFSGSFVSVVVDGVSELRPGYELSSSSSSSSLSTPSSPSSSLSSSFSSLSSQSSSASSRSSRSSLSSVRSSSSSTSSLNSSQSSVNSSSSSSSLWPGYYNDNLISYWSLDNIYDDIVSGHDMTPGGPTTFSTGICNQGHVVRTNGTYLKAPDTGDLRPFSKDDGYILSFWVKPPSPALSFISGRQGFGAGLGINVVYPPEWSSHTGIFLNGNMPSQNNYIASAYVPLLTGSTGVFCPEILLTPGAWAHLMLVVSQNTMSLFVNGQVTINSTKSLGASGLNPSALTGFWKIEASPDYSGFDFVVDEVAFWNGISVNMGEAQRLAHALYRGGIPFCPPTWVEGHSSMSTGSSWSVSSLSSLNSSSSLSSLSSSSPGPCASTIYAGGFGAGQADTGFNGTYILNLGPYNGKPYYNNVEGCYTIRWSGTRWEMYNICGSPTGVFYQQTTTGLDCPYDGAWTNVGPGAYPAGVVSRTSLSCGATYYVSGFANTSFNGTYMHRVIGSYVEEDLWWLNGDVNTHRALARDSIDYSWGLFITSGSSPVLVPSYFQDSVGVPCPDNVWGRWVQYHSGPTAGSVTYRISF